MVLGLGGGEALSTVDAAWLRMEHPTNLMTITGVLSFAEKLEFAALKDLIEDRLLCYDRFRQRVAEPGIPFARPRWVDDRTFNLRAHLQRIALPEPGSQLELQDLVSTLMSTPLDPSKPLWQLHYIENYRGGSAIVARLHHCIADGIALVRVLLGMTDESPAGARARRQGVQHRRLVGGGFWLPEVVDDAMRSVRRITGTVAETGRDPDAALRAIRESGRAAGVVARLTTMPPDVQTVFRGPLGTAKKAVWSAILPLREVRSYGRRVGATVNDVLLAGVTGALRLYLSDRGSVADGLDLRAVIPVNLRPEDEIHELGNRFGLVFLALPVGSPDMRQRLRILKERMDAIKRSSEAVVTYAILNALGMTSPEVEGVAVQFFGSKATAVMTNVPGPAETLFLAGKPLRSMMFWVPQSARLGLGVSIISYAGQVRLGVATDAGLVPDPETIIEAFQMEMTAMLSEDG
jgi:WS/DGAT/MGAT family acyltransferase